MESRIRSRKVWAQMSAPMRRKSRCVSRYSGTQVRAPFTPLIIRPNSLSAVWSGMCPSQLRQLKKRHWTAQGLIGQTARTSSALLMLYLDPNLRPEFISPGETIPSPPGTFSSSPARPRVLVCPFALPATLYLVSSSAKILSSLTPLAAFRMRVTLTHMSDLPAYIRTPPTRIHRASC